MITAMAKARTNVAQRQRRRGRPSVHHESWTKVSVVLFDRQITRLDRLVSGIRRQSGSSAINRTVIIRALIDALLTSQCDLCDSRSEADLRRCLHNTLRRGAAVTVVN
jgi:hypothetical protein